MGNAGRVDAGPRPPVDFLARAVQFTMMSSAKGNGEFVADLEAEAAGLCKAQMMGVAR